MATGGSSGASVGLCWGWIPALSSDLGHLYEGYLALFVRIDLSFILYKRLDVM
jgi:hypothetical protein